MIDPQLAGNVALVTGANNPHGIGAAVAEAFAAQGAAVFVTYLRQSPDALGVSAAEPDAATPGEACYLAHQADSPDAVLERLRAHGGRVDSLEVDLAEPAEFPRLFDQVEATLGPVAVLVNNAAYGKPDTLLPPSVTTRAPGDRVAGTITAEGVDCHAAVNCRAVALLMAEFARRHIERGATWGRIVNVSTDGARAFASEVSYGATKMALEGFSGAAAKEFAPYGITVNVLSLAAVQTGWIGPELQAAIERESLFRRMGEPADVADVVVFLASEQARWITGQVLYAGGGNLR